MSRKPVLITGSSGIGKTVIIKHMLKSLVSTGFSYKVNSILGDVFNYSEKKNQQTTQMSVVANLFDQEAENKRLKIEEYGVESLTPSEKKFLDNFAK